MTKGDSPDGQPRAAAGSHDEAVEGICFRPIRRPEGCRGAWQSRGGGAVGIVGGARLTRILASSTTLVE